MTRATDHEACPGCGAYFAPSDGPVHEYIGASAGCWAIYAPLAAGGQPDPAALGSSRVDTVAAVVPPPFPREGAGPLEALLVDAYAAQHPGEPSPQAIQSVAVHLLVLHAVFMRGVAGDSALWVRRRALRTRGVFHWLDPDGRAPALTLRHLFPGGGVVTPVPSVAYARSVYASWAAAHEGTLAGWYEDYVLGE